MSYRQRKSYGKRKPLSQPSIYSWFTHTSGRYRTTSFEEFMLAAIIIGILLMSILSWLGIGPRMT